ncbi:MAG: zinc ABC transporter substrate-binding protein [Treponema sp.]|nr:zinc ABC transporter substrate-binding protein [Treponema sp.]
MRGRPARCLTGFSRATGCLVLLLCCAAGCGRASPGNSGGPSAPSGGPVVAVSILPQDWFVSRVSGGRARTVVLAGPGQNPHTYEPSPKQMAGLAGAGVWILSGAEFETGLRPRVAALFPGLRIVDGTEGVVFRRLEEHDDDDHDEGNGGFDRHTWLGRNPAKILASHIRDALIVLDPDNADFYRRNCQTLTDEIDAEFDRLGKELAPLRGRAVFVYHPSFGYFLDEFGIKQEAVETGGKEPGPRDLGRLIEKAKREKAAVIFVQAQFPANAAATAARAAGAELVPLDPLDPDWSGNIRRMGGALLKALEPHGVQDG